MRKTIGSAMLLANFNVFADEPKIYDVKFQDGVEFQVCKLNQDQQLHHCDYYPSDYSTFTVIEFENEIMLTVCFDSQCKNYFNNYVAKEAEPPEPTFFKVDDHNYIEKPYDPFNPWQLKSTTGKGTSGFAKAMGKYGKKGVEKASEIIKSITEGAEEAGAWIVVDGVRVEGSYNSKTNSWKVTAKGSGWGCECSSDSQP